VGEEGWLWRTIKGRRRSDDRIDVCFSGRELRDYRSVCESVYDYVPYASEEWGKIGCADS